MAISIYVASVREMLSKKEYYDKAFLLSDEDRRNSVEKYQNQNDRVRSLAAGLLLKHALKKQGFFCDKEEIVIKRSRYGKPYLANQGFFFNLSHSGSLVACAVSDSEIGIDIQEHRKLTYRIADRFYHKEELELLNHCEDDRSKQTLFFDIWCAKESYMKFTGLGMAEDATEIVTCSDQMRDSKEKFTGLPFDTWIQIKTSEKREAYYRMLECEEGYSLCVCSEKQEKICSIEYSEI